MNKTLLAISMAAIVAPLASAGYAATPVDLSRQSPTVLKKYIPEGKALRGSGSASSVKEMSKNVDFNQTTHIRVQQTYAGYPVFGADAVVHVKSGGSASLRAAVGRTTDKNVSMNGVIYDDLQADLDGVKLDPTSKERAAQALQSAITSYQKQRNASFTTSKAESNLMVYVDDNNKAHWAYKVTFLTSRIGKMPAKPVYILDARNLTVYKQWNDLKTARALVEGGGVGGNPTAGKFTYDGAQGNRPSLKMERDEAKKLCYLRNETVIIKDVRKNDSIPKFSCKKPDNQHNGVFWNTLNDEANGGYSPNNDGLFSDMIVRDMYTQWFNVPMLAVNDKPQQVVFYVHDPKLKQNAYYNNGEMRFGEGDDESYPVVAPSVVAHEMSHGFTEQHSNLIYDQQSGGLNESFSDMADKAVEYFQYGSNNWNIDPELLKPGGRLLRYMDEPTKDCNGNKPGDWCSISHMNDYFVGLDVHFSSGVFNKAFYLISSKWNTKKAFEVMTQANINYWTSNTSFADAACGVLKATRDYKYDEQTVKDALSAVGVATDRC